MKIKSRFPQALRCLAMLLAAFGLLHLAGVALPMSTANAAPSNDVVAEVVQDAAQGGIPDILKLLIPTANVATGDNAPEVQPTEAATNVTTPNVVHLIDGTGGGADASSMVVGDTTYLHTPYDATIVGPDYGPSAAGGAAQAVADEQASGNPGVATYQGYSQGASAADLAAATDGKKSQVNGYGSPNNPGTGFVSVMPSQLGPVNIGSPATLEAGDHVDLYSQSGDCWTNFPSVRQVVATLGLALAACIPSTLDTHYGDPGYHAFEEDAVYDSAPGVTQHVDYTENGLVIGAEKLGIPLNEEQKQIARELVPQGQPGIQDGPTFREIVEDPAAALESTVDMFTGGNADPGMQTTDIPQADAIPLVGTIDQGQGGDLQGYGIDAGIQALENFANGTGDPGVQGLVDTAVDTFNQFTGGNANDVAPAPATGDFTAPVGDLGDLGNQLTDAVNQFTGGNNAGIDLAGMANGLLGVH